MRKSLLFLVSFVFMSFYAVAQMNGAIMISGVVKDENDKPLEGASIQIKDTKTGAISDAKGYFSIKANVKFPFKLVVSSLGFHANEVEVKSEGSKIDIQLQTQVFLANDVVVTASRQSEKALQSPVTIEKLDIRALKETPAPSFYDALANITGVQVTTASLTFKVPNTRGFNVPNNFRFMQLVDGVDVQSATLGVPLGNAIGPTELDIQSVEITPGASSALYGMNAINGMSQLLTKNPFTNQGLSVYQKTGVNHVDGKDAPVSLLTETAIRYAKAFNDKFAFKINASYFSGTDWVANKTGDFNPQSLANPLFPELSGKNNPAYDGINSYGNESNIAITDAHNRTFNVRRTGYAEKDLTDYAAKNAKLDVALHYKIHPNLELSYSYRVGTMDGIFQRGNRIRLQGVTVQNHKLELTGSDFVIRAYESIENSGKSYALKPLSDNLEASFKSNGNWSKDFTKALNTAYDGATPTGDALVAAMQQARAVADNGRFLPGTQAFNNQVAKIKSVNDWDIYPTSSNPLDTTGGAAFSTRSRFYQAEGTWNLHKYIHWANVLVGADYRTYDLIPDGNNFVDFTKPLKERNTPGGKDIHYGKYGGFVQLSKQVLDDKLKLTASLRYDKSTEFSGKFNPRLAAVYTLNKVHNFRASWQNGFRFPSLFEAYSFVNNGGVRRVGGLPIVEQGLNYFTNSLLLSSVTSFNTKVNTAATQQNISRLAAAQQNVASLKIANPKAIRPEQISSFEVGYKASLFENRLFIDANAYYNTYKYFIGQVDVTVPNKGSVTNLNDTAVLNSLINSSGNTKYRVQTNSQSSVKSYGYAVGVTYNLYKTYTVSGNANYNALQQAPNDALIPGFNTPNWLTNVSFGNRAIARNVGFNVVWHWQNSFYWQNVFGNGTVPAYSTLDAQVSFKLPKLYSTIKVGGQNVLNTQYIQYIGGPNIGAIYYVAITIDELLK